MLDTDIENSLEHGVTSVLVIFYVNVANSHSELQTHKVLSKQILTSVQTLVRCRLLSIEPLQPTLQSTSAAIRDGCVS